jgi:tetratricopeptide (TPR) repeat protein
MQTLILYLIFWLINQGPLDRSKRVNVSIGLLENAIEHQDHASAARQLRYMMDSLRVFDPEVRLNLAHSYYNIPDTLKARQQYARLDSVADVSVRSVAIQQLGVLAGKRNETEKALALFKTTLKTDPTNDEARYNYELLKKKHQEQKEEEQKNNPNKQEPSEYAKRLKAQAEAMVRERKYGEAYQLMREGLKKDKTVSNFNDFIKRIKTVSDINQ